MSQLIGGYIVNVKVTVMAKTPKDARLECEQMASDYFKHYPDNEAIQEMEISAGVPIK